LELAESSAWGISGLNLSAADFNEAYIKEHATKSISHGVAAAWALLFISKGDTSKMPRAVELVMSGDVRGASLSEAVAAKHSLKEEMGFSAEHIKAFCDKAASRFPLASAFARHKFSIVSSVVTSSRKSSEALTFENLCRGSAPA
jgi:hypothetical protein